jgi:hypothetical protein
MREALLEAPLRRERIGVTGLSWLNRRHQR